MPRLIAPSDGASVGEAHPRDRIGSPVLLVLERWITVVSKSANLGDNSMAPPVDHLATALEFREPDFGSLLIGFGSHAWRLIVGVELVEVWKVKSVALARSWAGGRHLVATVMHMAVIGPHIFWWQSGEMLKLLLQLSLLKNLRCRLDVAKRASHRGQAYLRAAAAPEAAITGTVAVGCGLTIARTQAGRRVSDGELCYRPHLSGYPAG